MLEWLRRTLEVDAVHNGNGVKIMNGIMFRMEY